MSRSFKAAAVAALVFLSGWAAPAAAIAPHQPPAPERIASGEIRLPSLRVDSDALEVTPALIGAAQRDALLQSRISPFLARHGQDWEVRWDARGDRAAVVQGTGIPLIPGRGNTLDAGSFGLSGDAGQDLARVAARARALIDTVPELLAADRLELELDRERSVAFGPGNTRWFLEFQQQIEGVPVEGAFLYVRIVQGNVVQFGAERVAEPAAPLRASAAPAAEALFARVWDALGFAPDTRIGEWLDRGSLRVYPMLPAGEAPAMAFEGLRGSGYAHRLLRRYVFRVDAHATWQVLADAHSGDVVDLRDLTVHADATVSGDVYPTTNTDPLVAVPFPFAAVGNNGAKVTDIDGVYDYSGGTATVTLDGQYFRMADACGAISLSSSTDGNLDLGGSGGTDCTTPGFGGAGNTHSSRTGFYHLTLINTKARAILPANAWLQSKVTANMNVNDVCNASWNGSAVNFFRSGSGCSNTGEIAAVFLHEWGHGLDSNTGGAAGENASGEAVGDTFAFLETRDSCIGPNFRPGVTCFNCTSCTGVRDVGDFALDGAATLATPANITSDSGLNCDRFACPYFTPSGFPYRGPMGYQGHCESHIASTANWDLKNALVEEFGESGWQRMDEIWYGSLVPSKSAFQVTSGGQCNASASVDGCGATNWYTVFLAADDDDGNLANGTPNACRIWDAFSAHGIACGARPACTEFGAPDFSLASNAPAQAVCAGTDVQFPIAIGSQNGFANPVTLAVDGVPAGASAGFASNPASPGTATTLDVSGTGAVAAGTYPLLVSGSATDSGGHDLALSLRVDTALGGAPAPQSPADGAIDVAVAPTLSWEAVPGAASYSVEVATDAAFSNIVAQQPGLAGTSWQVPGLLPETAYVWRVSAHNGCGSSAASAGFGFTTVALYCRQPNLAIPDNNPTGATDTMTVVRSGSIESLRLRVRANHTWVGDVGFTLSRNGGAPVAVFDRPGVPGSTYGCSSDNIDVLLDDAAANPVETACAGSPPAIAGTLRPNALLDPAFAGLDFAGSWTLRATDAFSGDTGTVLEWCLEPTLEATTTYSVGGNVSGLLGSGLALSLNGGAPLPIAANGDFSFPDDLEDGDSFEVTVASDPSAPNQACEVSGGSGSIAGADAQVDVACTTLQYAVGGTVSGLAGSGLTLSLNGGAPLPVAADGPFQFPEMLDDGSAFAVSVASQPADPTQSCEVSDGSGSVAGGMVQVGVSCTTQQYSVGAQVSGLAGSGLALSLNGGAPVAVATNGSLVFPGALDDGTGYAVTVVDQPSAPNQVCDVADGEGTLAGTDVEVAVTCTTLQYAVGGTVSGLAGSGLVLDLNGSATLPVTSDGGFTFPALDDGSSFEVTIQAAPTQPSQDCAVDGGAGALAGANVDSVVVSCSTPPRAVRGQVSGLLGGGLSVALNGGPALPLDANGPFLFAQSLLEGESYAVTIASQPTAPEQVCGVLAGSGTVGPADVEGIEVACFPIGVFSDDFE